MEWSKTTISRAELEKKQREYMEAAMNMAKKAAITSVKKEPPAKEEIVAEIVEETDDLTGLLNEIKEKNEEKAEETEETAEHFSETETKTSEEHNEQFGVFNADELVNAIESGEVTGEGLRQAAEILEEMTQKTETMRKLIEEQEKSEDYADGGDYGLNSFIKKHNSHCRGCGNESDTQSP